jgi:uncharacterized protein YwqG
MAETNKTELDIPLFCKKHGLGGYTEQIRNLQLAALAITQSRTSMDQLATGASRIGGIPDLPLEGTGERWQGSNWPAIDGVPLEFLAQFNLSELKDYQSCLLLPKSGHLLIFYGFGINSNPRRSQVRVIYANGIELHRPSEPWEIPDTIQQFHPTTLRYSETLKLPHPGSWAVSELAFNEEEIDRYNLVYREWANHRPYGTSNTYFFGYPFIFNCPENPDAPAPKDILSRKGNEGYRCLFQIGGNDESGISIGDLGLLSFFIHKDDLAKADFSDCWDAMETT